MSLHFRTIYLKMCVGLKIQRACERFLCGEALNFLDFFGYFFCQEKK